ncbi:MAG: LytTR family DNA-binding domain-containing protein [Eubacteriales bacterium]
MKIILDVQENLEEDEIRIHCRELNDEIMEIQKYLQSAVSKRREIVVYKDENEYYLSLNDALFFETAGREIMLHTEENAFLVKYKLYELEEMLPDNFVRISKSTILNVSKVYAINRNGVTNGMIEFHNTHKQVAVSRMYYKNFRFRLEKKRR